MGEVLPGIPHFYSAEDCKEACKQASRKTIIAMRTAQRTPVWKKRGQRQRQKAGALLLYAHTLDLLGEVLEDMGSSAVAGSLQHHQLEKLQREAERRVEQAIQRGREK